MRAARIHEYGEANVLTVDEVPKPSPGARDVLVRVHAASVNPVDTKIRAGSQQGAVRLRLPWILGLDVAGVVEEVGKSVRGFAVGDEVVSSPSHRRPGTYAEWVAIDEREVAHKPKKLDFNHAATLPLVGLTAWACLVEKAHVAPGDRVLIHAGAGGVGVIAIQIAKHFGATVATTASTRNVDFLKELGADVVIDYTQQEFDEELSDYDAVLESLGPDIAKRSLSVLRRGGHLTSINTGLPAAADRYGPTLGVVAVALRIVGSTISARIAHGIKYSTVVRRPNGKTLAEICALVDRGSIQPVIAEVFPLERIADAHRAQESQRTRGKLVIQIRP